MIFAIQGAGPAGAGEPPLPRAPEPSDPLTLAQALALVVTHSPQLASVAAEVRARDAHALQAAVLRNPELRTDVENVGGSGTRDGFEDTETTVRLSQLIELGGKRAKRRRVAELDRELAGWDYEGKKRALVSDATKAFIRALAAQEQVRLATELSALARRAVSAADAQVRAGAAPPVETARARVALDRSELERGRSERAFDAARRALAATWGSHEATFHRLDGTLAVPAAMPSFDALRSRLEESPDLARWMTELEERGATVALEESGRIPDVTVGAGGRHFSDNDDTAAVFELSVPLPVFNRNQGAIAEAHHRLEKARADRDAAHLELNAALASAYAEMAAAHEQAIRLRDHVIPGATRSTDGAVDAYRQGLFRFVDVLDAQRTLFELRGEYLKALETFQLQAAEVARLTGGAQ